MKAHDALERMNRIRIAIEEVLDGEDHVLNFGPSSMHGDQPSVSIEIGLFRKLFAGDVVQVERVCSTDHYSVEHVGVVWTACDVHPSERSWHQRVVRLAEETMTSA